MLSERSRRSRIVAALLRRHTKNRTPENLPYPQGWYCMPRTKWLRRLLQYLCRLATGHELSRTEWGYGGGDTADCWCRWCDQMIEVPKEQLRFTHPSAHGPMSSIPIDPDQGEKP